MEHFSNELAHAGVGQLMIKLASTGQMFPVPEASTINRVLADNGIKIPVSCEQGVCGTCLTRVLGGVVKHNDLYLSDAEKAKNDQMTPCCSRAEGVLVLDI